MSRTQAGTTRAAAMVLGATALALLGLLLFSGAAAEAAPQKFKTTTRNVFVPADIDIPGVGNFGPAAPYPSATTVGANVFPDGAKIVDVNLTLRSFGHQAPAEVDMMLVHAGVNRTVMSDAGGIQDVGGLKITLDNQAGAFLPGGFNTPLTSGTFKPTNFDGNGEGFDPPAPTPSGLVSLAGFNGKNPEGPWKLFVDDDSNVSTGFMNDGYRLTIKAKFPAK